MWQAGNAISQSPAATDTARLRASRCRQADLENRQEGRPNTDKLLQEALLASPLLNEFLSAFSATTGIRLGFLKVGSGEAEILQALRLHPFGALLLNTESERLRCVQHLKKLIREVTVDNFAKISASICSYSYVAMPLNDRGQLIGILLAGPMFPRAPRPRDWMRASHQLTLVRAACNDRSARDSYFEIPAVSPDKLQGIIRLLSMFAAQVSESARRFLLSAADTQPLCVTRAKEFIQEKSTEQLTVAHVARRAAVHPDYLGKLFKDATGMTLTEYIARVRVENVKERLPERSCRVAEAAFAAGFQSLAQFNRHFRKYTGVCPSRYRASLLAGQLSA